MFEYKWVDYVSLHDIRTAEKMQRAGWKTVQAGITRILMQREKKKKKTRH